jgi:uncharacterized membrane protein YkvA (DUF1232 family)
VLLLGKLEFLVVCRGYSWSLVGKQTVFRSLQSGEWVPIFLRMEMGRMNTAKIAKILAPVDAGEDASRESRVRAGFWRTAKRAARHVPFMEDVVAGYYAALDRNTPLRVRGTLLAALAYFVMPLDVIPDFLLAFGFTDDIAVLAAAITAIRGHIKPEHHEAARAALTRD